MARKQDLSCPVCDADVPLGGDEANGDTIHCAYCGAPSLVKFADDEPTELEEDY